MESAVRTVLIVGVIIHMTSRGSSEKQITN